MKKDIGKKKLQEHEDVFADIFNSLVFSGKEVVHPSELALVPTTGHHKDAGGELRERTRDVLMKDIKSGTLYLLMGLENQDYIDNTMPLRCMGYDFTAYDKQVKDYMDENRKQDKSAYHRKIHKEQKLVPVITLVTYYGEKEWDAPKDIYGMLNIPEELKQEALPFIHNYHMNFIHMGKLPPEVRARFTSDIRVLVEYLACNNNYEKLEKLTKDMNQPIHHPEDLLDALSTIADDKRYAELKDVIINKPEKEEMNMCILAETLENRGIAKGVVTGKAEAVIELLEEYGAVPEWLRDSIMQETDLERLKSLHKLSAKVESIEEFIEKSGIKVE